MEENVRTHERIEEKEYPGLVFKLNNVLKKPIDIYIPERLKQFDSVDLIIHFHGASYVAMNAVHNSEKNLVLAVVNEGHGSSVYEKAFTGTSTFPNLIKQIADLIKSKKSVSVNLNKIYFTSFSAGYGAVREIIKTHSSLINGILLLDGLHTDYIPDRKTLADGGELNTEKLKRFLQYAELAINNECRFMITHSEIYPGTYASLTETTDWLIEQLGLTRTAVLNWGPVGMQQISELRKNNFTVLGFAGNSARDHIDHYHALPKFLDQFLME